MKLINREEVLKKQEEVYKRACDGFLKITLDLFIMYDKEKIKLVNIENQRLNERKLGTLPAEKYKKYVRWEEIYDSHKELFKKMDMNIGIENDLLDMEDELYDENGNWNYEISKEDIMQLISFGEEIDLSLLEKSEREQIIEDNVY